MALLSDGGKNTLFGVVLVIFAVIFLFSGLDLVDFSIFSDELDILFAFILIIVGMAYVFSEVGKPKQLTGLKVSLEE